jgi:hypothetical protein
MSDSIPVNIGVGNSLNTCLPVSSAGADEAAVLDAVADVIAGLAA